MVLQGEMSAESERVLRVLENRIAIAVVPGIWRHEILNGLGKGVSRQRLDLASAMLWHQLNALPIFVLEFVLDEELLQLAVDQNLSIYDASYLSLDLARHVPLASFDEKLLRAAESMGVQILQPQFPPAPIQ